MRILLAVDGSPYSEAAIKEVASRVWPAGTEVKIVTAFELPLAPAPEVWALPPDYFEQLEQAARDHAKSVNDGAVVQLKGSAAPTIEISGEILAGSARSVILEEAEAWAADLIVLGSHGYGAWQRFLLGSVSQAVVSHAKCSVEVVRISHREKQEVRAA
jgi:nucleotide-binding universal stress UspA family protein